MVSIDKVETVRKLKVDNHPGFFIEEFNLIVDNDARKGLGLSLPIELTDDSLYSPSSLSSTLSSSNNLVRLNEFWFIQQNTARQWDNRI